MSRYFVILFATLYFTPLSQFWTVDKETCSERWKRFFFTKKMPAHCFKQQCHSTSQKHYCHLLRHSKTISRVIFKWLQRAIKAHADRVLCRTEEKCGNSVSASRGLPLGRELCSCLTLKEKARQLVLVSESRGSRGMVTSASNPLGAGYINKVRFFFIQFPFSS